MIAFLVVFVVVGVWSGNPWVGVLAGLLAGGLSVWFFPWTKCLACAARGSSKVLDSWGTSWRNCQVCGGSGKRKRLLARVIGGIDD